jgi:hypothetical protein
MTALKRRIGAKSQIMKVSLRRTLPEVVSAGGNRSFSEGEGI